MKVLFRRIENQFQFSKDKNCITGKLVFPKLLIAHGIIEVRQRTFNTCETYTHIHTQSCSCVWLVESRSSPYCMEGQSCLNLDIDFDTWFLVSIANISKSRVDANVYMTGIAIISQKFPWHGAGKFV